MIAKKFRTRFCTKIEVVIICCLMAQKHPPSYDCDLLSNLFLDDSLFGLSVLTTKVAYFLTPSSM